MARFRKRTLILQYNRKTKLRPWQRTVTSAKQMAKYRKDMKEIGVHIVKTKYPKRKRKR